MLSFLKRILPQRIRIREPEKETTPVKSSTVRLIRSEVSKYPIKNTGKFIYSKHDFFINDQDSVWERINGYHTCAVYAEIDFEQAKSMSRSFTITINDLNDRENYKSLEAMSLLHPLEDAYGSCITWRLHDGRKQLSDATDQLPNDRPSVIHVGIESHDGAVVEDERFLRILNTVSLWHSNNKDIHWIYCHIFDPQVPPDENWDFGETVLYFSKEKAFEKPLQNHHLVDLENMRFRDGVFW